MSTNVVPLHRWASSTTYGDRIRRTRLDYGTHLGEPMTQERFAQIIGVGDRALSAWEKDRNLPKDPVAMAHHIADTIGCDVGFILGYTDGNAGPGGQRTPVVTDGSSFACTRTRPDQPPATVTQLQRRAA